ncbi:MAG: hypothetical protein QNL62_22560 [Gammaproteobacteria bacterium]|nr:hypothetical protein [Gammaproteobacteria bacterium]
MADILKYTCNVSDVNCRYQEIHNEIFSLSVHKLVRNIVTDKSVSFKKHEDELKTLQGKLMNIQTTLDALPQSELNIRRGKEIFLTLSNYVTALTKSIDYLQKICHNKNTLSGSDSNLVNYKKGYDDAIQYHKNLGIRLNGLLSSF